ncbi:MAG TPA: M20/M25/M40 family metallo-hydrolase [Pyrinomonadaceae bacterium]|jgi:type III secretory pathway component EscS|nr:M20/M25/M40 family metallo-hydrolase [Pyrinomonadaceae bacterium]
MKSAIGPWFVLFFILTPVVFLAFYLHRPPEVVSASAPLSEFSAERAFEHLKVLASRPHPVGSLFHDNVREYIVGVLTKLELQPELQVSERRDPTSTKVLKFENIVARLPGNEPGKGTLLLAAHYDTVSQSPGASDDGSGVVTLLEAAAALKARSALKRDVVLLISDGEEAGFDGAKTFLKSSLFPEISLVLNFDARGSRGPVFMFETGDNNYWTMKEFGKVAPFPFTNSLNQEIYDALPHHTDFTFFKNRGVPGFNFAYLGGLENYHSANDSLGTVDLRSIQHQGSYALALTSHFGNLELNQRPHGNAVFFEGLGRVLISYPEGFVRPIALVISLLSVGVLVWGWRRRSLSLGWSALGLLLFLISAVCTVLMTTLIGIGLNLYFSESEIQQHGIPLLIGLTAFNVALIVFIYWSGATNCSFRDLSAGALIGWLLCMLVVSYYFPLASYILQWSLLASIAAFAINVSLTSSSSNWLTVVATNCLGAVPGIVLFIWHGQGLFLAAGLRWPFLLSIAVVLLIGLLLPSIEFLVQSLRVFSSRRRSSLLRSLLPRVS